MKNLANCKPSEFLKQTNLIRKSVEKWLKLTDIMNIRRRVPEGMPEVTPDLSDEEKAAVEKKRREMILAKAQENLKDILDACLEKYPDETLEVLALCCFVEPENVDDFPVKFYLASVLEMVEDETVARFFTLLMQLAN